VIDAARRALRASYPFLMAATPVLYLAVRNTAQVAPDQLLAPLLVLLGATGLALLLLRRLLGDAPRAAVLVTVALIVLFTGGSLYETLVEALGVALRWGAFAMAAGVAAALLWATLRFCSGERRVEAATLTFSVMALVLFANMAGPLLFTAKGRAFFAPDRAGFDSPPPEHPVLAAESPQSPDIYYIIADAYARADALQAYYGFDNREFLDWLEQRGFYIAGDSWSNYQSTYLSLASSLNMRLLDDVFAQLQAQAPDAREIDRTAFYRLIQSPEIARRLQARGYRYAQVLTHWGGTDRSAAADLHYRFAPFLGGEFSGTLAGMTLLRAFLPTVDQLHRFVAETVPRIAEVPGPTFAFVHLLLPHNPYVFDRQGRVIAASPLTLSMNLQESAWAQREPYVEQLHYTNVLLRGMIEGILARSKVPPIIVLQGDHGSSWSGFQPQRRGLGIDPRERLAILNAYLVPPAVRAQLRPDITPVNSFRTVLSAQFGEDLPPLPDRSYFAVHAGEDPYVLRDVTAELRAPPVTPAASTSSR
jgi:hypothetical protein